MVIRDALNDPDYPFREEARQRGYGSMIGLPLLIQGELAGSMSIVAAETDAFDDREVELLMATAADLGYGLAALRARARAAAAEETIRRMAYFDSVTGLPNRVRLRDLLEEAIAAAKDAGRPLALLRIEMERFRDINETIGHHGSRHAAAGNRSAARDRRGQGRARWRDGQRASSQSC